MPDPAAALRHLQKASDYDDLETENARLRSELYIARGESDDWKLRAGDRRQDGTSAPGCTPLREERMNDTEGEERSFWELGFEGTEDDMDAVTEVIHNRQAALYVYGAGVRMDKAGPGMPVELERAEARAEAAETALREAEGWIQEVDHVEDCAAFDRTSSRECDCGRTAVLKRARTTTTEEVPHVGRTIRTAQG
jgi:hypothetical protein